MTPFWLLASGLIGVWAIKSGTANRILRVIVSPAKQSAVPTLYNPFPTQTYFTPPGSNGSGSGRGY